MRGMLGTDSVGTVSKSMINNPEKLIMKMKALSACRKEINA
jgi:hypothetical protein